MSGYLIPRKVDATAVIFTEPEPASFRTSIARNSLYGVVNRDRRCNRPIIDLSQKISRLKNKTASFIDPVSLKIEKLTTKISSIKMQIVDKLRIGCLIPKLIRPFEPILKYIRCKLGLEEDEFMEAPQCHAMICEESLEEQVITNDLGPPPMTMMNLEVQTMSDCFGDMKEIQYGARVLAKIVRDQSCDDPQYQEICKELMSEGRVLDEESCQNNK